MRKKPLVTALVLSAVGAAMIPVVRKMRRRGAATLDREEPGTSPGDSGRSTGNGQPARKWSEAASSSTTPAGTAR